MLGEGLVIIVSVLVALSADAWWDGLQEARRVREHMDALSRDFEQMSARADSSFDAATRGMESAGSLEENVFRAQTALAQDSALAWLAHILWYEAFSPSTGAYEALVASGEIESLRDNDLKRALAEIFGSFEDMRVSERLLIEGEAFYLESEDFSRLVGAHRLSRWHLEGRADLEPAQIRGLAGSHVLRNATIILLLRHMDTRNDYQYLRDRIAVISDLLERELSGN